MTMSILSSQKFTSFPAPTNRFAAGQGLFNSSEPGRAQQERPRRFERSSFSLKIDKARAPHLANRADILGITDRMKGLFRREENQRALIFAQQIQDVVQGSLALPVPHHKPVIRLSGHRPIFQRVKIEAFLTGVRRDDNCLPATGIISTSARIEH
jgi:hypothetical protein